MTRKMPANVGGLGLRDSGLAVLVMVSKKSRRLLNGILGFGKMGEADAACCLESAI